MGVIHWDYDLYLYHFAEMRNLVPVYDPDIDAYRMVQPTPEQVRAKIDESLSALEAEGLIERDGEYILVHGYQDYQGYRGAKIQAAVSAEAVHLRGKTRFSDRVSTIADRVSPQNITEQNITEHSPAQSGDCGGDCLDGIDPPPDPVAAYEPAAVQVCEMLTAYLEAHAHDAHPPVVAPADRRNPQSLAVGMLGSGLPPDRLLDAYRWALSSPYQIKVLLNMRPFTRRDGAAWTRLVNAQATEPPRPAWQQQPAPQIAGQSLDNALKPVILRDGDA
jgi:hypothetical protein